MYMPVASKLNQRHVLLAIIPFLDWKHDLQIILIESAASDQNLYYFLQDLPCNI